MSDPFQDVDSAGIEFAETTAKTMEIRQSEPVMEKIVKDYLDELEFTHRKLTIEIGCGPGAISRRISNKAFYEEVGEHISKIDKEILTWTYRKDEGDNDKPSTLDLDTILSADDDVSQWKERHQLWYAQR